MISLSQDAIARFRRDGFVVVDGILDSDTVARVVARFAPLFRGEFGTGIQPDEWNWREGRDPPELTRQICNGWKADREIARVVLREDIGRACALLMDWPGARINQDNVLWKPPHGRALGFHQDESYQSWVVPPAMASCWIALDDTAADRGSLEYVRGSHAWPLAKMIDQFHAPEDPQREMREAAARQGVAPEIVPVVVPAGGGAFHHGRTWHGSSANGGAHERRSVVAHCISSAAHFHPENKGPVYSRYQRPGDRTMDEAFFPVLWERSGERSSYLESYLVAGDGGRGGGA